MSFPDNLFLRRLHSLTGALPLGGFLLFHLYANTFSLSGEGYYDQHVKELRSLPYLHVMEWALIFLPLAFHAGYGLYIWYTSENNFPQYRFVRNGLFSLQRVTGLVAFVFIGYHLYDQRLLTDPSFGTVSRSLDNPLVFILYFLGVTATAWHMMNGLWNVTIKWGLAAGETAQKVSLAVFTALGLGLVYAGLRALTGFM